MALFIIGLMLGAVGGCVIGKGAGTELQRRDGGRVAAGAALLIIGLVLMGIGISIHPGDGSCDSNGRCVQTP